MKTPPASEDANGVFHAFTSRKVAALKRKRQGIGFVPPLRNSLGGILLAFHLAHFVGDNGEQASAGLPQRQNEGRLVPFMALPNVVS